MSSTMGERQSESLKKKKKKSNGEVFAATSVKDVVEKGLFPSFFYYSFFYSFIFTFFYV